MTEFESGQRAGRLPGLAGAGLVLLALCASSCGYRHWAGPLRPVEPQPAGLAVADDGSITFTRARLEVVLRPLTDEELNRQFGVQSTGGQASTNPYTYGDRRFEDGDEQHTRFTVFQLRVKNYAFPKVRIDPASIQLATGNGRRYWSLNLAQLETYYRAYATGYGGNAYGRFKARLDLLRRTMFSGEPVFSGQERSGFVVFPVLHADVRAVEVTVHDAVLRFDFRDEPAETVDIAYRFERDVGRRRWDGQLVVLDEVE